MRISTLLVGAMLALGGCASTPEAPTYQAARGANMIGYMNSAAVDGRAPVVYTGGPQSSQAEVARLALLRAAEFTLESGHEWFAVLGTENVRVPIAQETDLTSRGRLDSEGASTGTGAPPSEGGGPVNTNMGPSIGGFGGGDVPYQVVERWTPQQGYQTRLIIQMGSGDQASFPGAADRPEIFPARSTAETIRSEL